MKNKKNILMLVTILLMTTALTVKAQLKETSPMPNEMEGSWKVIVVPQQFPIPLPPSIEGIVTYVPGGGLIESDNLGVPNIIASTGQGVWEPLSNRSIRKFRLSFTKYLFSTQGLFQGSVRATETITLLSSDSYKGEGKLETLSPTGVILISIPVKTTAHRIRISSEDTISF